MRHITYKVFVAGFRITFFITVVLLLLRTSLISRNIQRVKQYFTFEYTYKVIEEKYIFNCTNMDKIRITKYEVGDGRSKVVDIGYFNGQVLAVKRLSILKQEGMGWESRQMFFMKEIIMRDQLEHSSIIKMYGFCLRHLHIDYQGQNLLKYSDISAVYEYGNAFDVRTKYFTIQERLRHALELADLLSYLHSSPLGSMLIVDFKSDHFLMVNNRIKLIDLDYISNVEHGCHLNQTFTPCPFNCPCEPLNKVERSTTFCEPGSNCNVGVCRGCNVRFNIYNMYNTFLKYLLEPSVFPVESRRSLTDLLSRLLNNSVKIEEFVNGLISILRIHTKG
ncbi:extracellular tyrosine-protein kinase PKDCC-like isoform X1 [Mytilus californianus]|uniref:extracellular tyrosine-protein kinase PKDCC-like isoform X1 n=1 Tax=Mytilus californianus TaxID=6549 RepID=UPI002247E257|nr:extracellular tyrosine-protein kinase PKDCC-like isoform X1 [Mytilus californianus]